MASFGDEGACVSHQAIIWKWQGDLSVSVAAVAELLCDLTPSFSCSTPAERAAAAELLASRLGRVDPDRFLARLRKRGGHAAGWRPRDFEVHTLGEAVWLSGVNSRCPGLLEAAEELGLTVFWF
jgi:hypothetical protein